MQNHPLDGRKKKLSSATSICHCTRVPSVAKTGVTISTGEWKPGGTRHRVVQLVSDGFGGGWRPHAAECRGHPQRRRQQLRPLWLARTCRAQSNPRKQCTEKVWIGQLWARR